MANGRQRRTVVSTKSNCMSNSHNYLFHSTTPHVYICDGCDSGGHGDDDVGNNGDAKKKSLNKLLTSIALNTVSKSNNNSY